MSESLRELYQEVILDHNKSPRNFKELEDATHTAEGFNPLCGDRYSVYVKLSDNVIDQVTFKGEGCAISKSSASLMTEAMKGTTLEEAEKIFADIQQLLTQADAPELEGRLHKLNVLQGVHEFPARIKCASLAWHALENSLKDGSTATTE